MIKYLTSGPQITKDIQNMKIIIDSIEYDYLFFKQMENEYLKHEKILKNTNKQSISESCGFMVQIF